MLGSRADLHVHTNASDGTRSPGEAVRLAHSLGLAAIAITDHDSVAGLPEAIEAGRSTGVEVVAGVEINTEHHGRDIHILGYHVDCFEPRLLEGLALSRGSRVRRVRLIVERLNHLGIRIDLDRVMFLAGEATVGRPHIARVLVEDGRVHDLKEAFDLLLGQGAPAYVPRDWFTPFDAVGLVIAAGGAPVLAHPASAGGDAVIAELQPYGLAGIEVDHPDHEPGVVRHYRRLANARGLIATGGSDSHGPGVDHRTAIGGRTCPAATVESLLRAARGPLGRLL
jgi:predicted metal-dependent phosphoesterase TrpH